METIQHEVFIHNIKYKSYDKYKEALEYICNIHSPNGLEASISTIKRRRDKNDTLVTYLNEPDIVGDLKKMVLDIIEDFWLFECYIKNISTTYSEDSKGIIEGMNEKTKNNWSDNFKLSKCIQYMRYIEYISNLSFQDREESYNKKLQNFIDKSNGIVTLLIFEYGGYYNG